MDCNQQRLLLRSGPLVAFRRVLTQNFNKLPPRRLAPRTLLDAHLWSIPLFARTLERVEKIYIARKDCTGIVGKDRRTAMALIEALVNHIVRPAFVYQHRWRVGDVVV